MKSQKKPLAHWAIAALGGVSVGMVVLGTRFCRPQDRPSEAAPRSFVSQPPAAELDDILPMGVEFDDFELIDLDGQNQFGLSGVVTTLSDFQIPVTKRTLKYVTYFATEQKGRQAFAQRFRRGSRLRDIVERTMLELGLPQDLVWLAAIESGFRPQAVSEKGAVGLFQFMPATAQRFGLMIEPEIDERRSITKATSAAAALLDHLYRAYGAWDLALAAYNCGQHRVDLALERAEQLLGPREGRHEFHELAEKRLLPKETADFVPMIHAFAIVTHNLAQLDLDDTPTLLPMSVAELSVPGNTSLSVIARAADMSLSDLREYNPQFLVDATPDIASDTQVLLPPDRLDRARAALPTMLLSSGTAATDESDLDIDALTAAGARPAATDEKPAQRGVPLISIPGQDNAYLLQSGVTLLIEPAFTEELRVQATVTVQNPARPDGKALATFAGEVQRGAAKELNRLLQRAHTEVGSFLRSEIVPKLYASTLEERKASYPKLVQAPAFEALSARMFGRGHPLRGALLVGPTRSDSDRFVDIEPTWAVSVTLRVRGKVDMPVLSSVVEDVIVDPLASPRLPKLPHTGEVTLDNPDAGLVIGWGSRANRPEEEAAWRMAVVLACDERVGRLSDLARRRRPSSERFSCALERSPVGNVAWVSAYPAKTVSFDELERSILEALVFLSANGPTEDEIESARDIVRVDTERRKQRAPSAQGSKRSLDRDAERVLRHLDQVSRDEIVSATRWVFNTHHRITVAPRSR